MKLTDNDKKQICYYFAHHIPRIRKAMNLTQKEFGHLVGASKERINAIENGRAPLRWSLYCSILFFCFANLDSKEFLLHNHMIDPRTFRFLQFTNENSMPLLNINAFAAGTYLQRLYPNGYLAKDDSV